MYIAKYRCRLCKEKYGKMCASDKGTASSETMYIVLGIEPELTMFPRLHDVHYCKDGSVGLADYLGFKNEP